jgi:hypothetical protein
MWIGQLGGGVRVRQAAAYRAAVADRRVRHQADRLGHQRRVHGHLRGPLDLGHPGHGPDDQRVALSPDPGQPGHAAQINQVTRLGQPEVHHGDQALAPGQHPGLGIGMLGEQPDGLVQGQLLGLLCLKGTEQATASMKASASADNALHSRGTSILTRCRPARGAAGGSPPPAAIVRPPRPATRAAMLRMIAITAIIRRRGIADGVCRRNAGCAERSAFGL